MPPERAMQCLLMRSMAVVLLLTVAAAAVDPWAGQLRPQRLSTAAEAVKAGVRLARKKGDFQAWIRRIGKTYSPNDLPKGLELEGTSSTVTSSNAFAGATLTDSVRNAVTDPAAVTTSPPPVRPPPRPSSPLAPPTVTVDCEGTGNFTRVQAAVDYLSAQRSAGKLMGPIVLFIKSCTYTEKIEVASNLYNMTIRGENAYSVFLTWDDTAGTMVRGQSNKTVVYGTYGSASTALKANDLIIVDITFVNSAPMPDPGAPPTGQAVACRVDGDRVAFYSCRFFGWQDTLYDRYGRHFFRNCYIQGRVDFICGNGQSVYEFCTIYSPLQGAFAAQKQDLPTQGTGYVFFRCRILGDGLMTLGRAWGNYSRTIFAYCYIENIVNPQQPWSDFGYEDRRSQVYFGEYRNFGPGAVDVKRDNWTGTYIMSDDEARPFIRYSFINKDRWLVFPPPQQKSGPFYAPDRLNLPPYPPGPYKVWASPPPPPPPAL